MMLISVAFPSGSVGKPGVPLSAGAHQSGRTLLEDNRDTTLCEVCTPFYRSYKKLLCYLYNLASSRLLWVWATCGVFFLKWWYYKVACVQPPSPLKQNWENIDVYVAPSFIAFPSNLRKHFCLFFLWQLKRFWRTKTTLVQRAIQAVILSLYILYSLALTRTSQLKCHLVVLNLFFLTSMLCFGGF